MILYFTGTGNGRYIAQRIAKELPQETVFINEKIKNSDHSLKADEGPLVFVLPTYCWRIPKTVEKWIRETPFKEGADAYFIMHCGSETGNAQKYLKKLCRDKNFTFRGLAEIVMPENYTALYAVPSEKTSLKIIEKANPEIDKAIDKIRFGADLLPVNISLQDRIKSSVVNFFFYKFIVKDKKFQAADFCTGCQTCEKLCPLNNISLENGKPVWHGNCTHCMACINRCPERAIEYGKATRERRRYTCPKA